MMLSFKTTKVYQSLAAGLFVLAALPCSSAVQADSLKAPGLSQPYQGNGAQQLQPCSGKLLASIKVPKLQIPLTPSLRRALQQQQQYLQIMKNKGQMLLSSQESTLYLNTYAEHIDIQAFTASLLMGGEDLCGNTLLTAYNTPLLKVSANRSGDYQYPIYQLPKDKAFLSLSRAQIESEALLKEYGLELGYAANPLDVFLAQVQGSAILEDVSSGSRQLIGYAGKNQHPYKSLGQMLIRDGKIDRAEMSVSKIREYFAANPTQLQGYLFENPSYVFFKPSQEEWPRAANNTSALPGVTAAVDPQLIPFGSLILVEEPVLNGKQITARKWTLRVANDRGGAIKGSGRLDLYEGTSQNAGNVMHYGRVILLQQPLAAVSVSGMLAHSATEQ
jgi:membrane-bound lytic murein transglycosylase A